VQQTVVTARAVERNGRQLLALSASSNDPMTCWSVLQTVVTARAVGRNVMLTRAPSASSSVLMDCWSGDKAAITGRPRVSGTPPVVANQVPTESQLLMEVGRVFATHTRVFTQSGKVEKGKTGCAFAGSTSCQCRYRLNAITFVSFLNQHPFHYRSAGASHRRSVDKTSFSN
jgi:hypothetical protein